MTWFADPTVAVIQAFATGRLAERVTLAPIVPRTGLLSYRTSAAGDPVPLAARFEARAGGWFAFTLNPARDAPDLTAAATVILRARFETSRGELSVESAFDPAAFQVEEAELRIGNRTLRARRVRGAPFDLTLLVDPALVALEGVVLRDNDPADPAVGVSIEIAPEAGEPGLPITRVTDASGRFATPALPPVRAVVLNQLDAPGGPRKLGDHVVDYTRRVNTVHLSAPS